MANRSRTSIHGTGALDYVSARPGTDTASPHVWVSFTYADHDLTLFLEYDRENLAKVAAQFRVLANQIDHASDHIQSDRLRSILTEVDA